MNKRSKQRVALFFGGVSSEHEVSCVSASAWLRTLQKSPCADKYDVTCVGITKNGRWLACPTVTPETMADRSGDDLHAMDTRQELMSLSARFGLTITFQQPDKDRYDHILLELAKQYGVQMPSDQLFIKGAAFALRAGGRSPRVAKQFVELLAAGVNA